MARDQSVKPAEAVHLLSVHRQDLVSGPEDPADRCLAQNAADDDVRQLDRYAVAEASEGDGRGDLLRVRHLREVDLLRLFGRRVAEHVALREEGGAARERAAEQILEQVRLAEADVHEIDTAAPRRRMLARDAHEGLQRVRAVGQEDVVLVRGDQVENAQRDHS